MRGKARLCCGFVCVMAVLVLPELAGADIGFRGPAYPAGTSGVPTGSKPESKLWRNDGFWWASMFDNSRNYHIFRLNLRWQKWVDTGVVIDTRDSTRQDVISTGGKLLVASHKFKAVTNFNPGAVPADGMRLYRFDYNPATNRYRLDGSFLIDLQRSEALTIAADSNGFVWATWVQENSGGQHEVYVKRTNGNCVSGAIANCAFTGPTVVLDAVGADDISSIVRFGNRVGVMWSDTPGSAFRFATHAAGAPVTTWSAAQTVISGPKVADDHINLKADSAGRVYAAVKTKFSSAANPGTVLHRRTATGTWTHHTISNGSLRRTRPLVLLDQGHNAIRVFEGTPGGSTIFMKRSRLNAISFRTGGSGAPAIRDDGSTVGSPTSTKQNITNGTRLIVLASNDSTRRYWHGYQQIVPCIRASNATGNNRLVGTVANDRMCGGGGRDRLNGLRGNDRLLGGKGRDTLVGKAGRDRFLGGAGNDRFFSRDGFRDVLRGGAGFDRARVNASDIRRSIEALF
jgi:RTX calcium-binding nonapeptide repeat (4 copies)